MSRYGKESIWRYIEKFSLTHGVVTCGSNALVAFSGGMDSVLLAEFLYYLKNQGVIKNLTLLYIDHNTRKVEIEKEKEFIAQFAQQRNLPFFIESLDLSLEISNFENTARKLRYEIFEKYSLEMKAEVFLGHHIDDSFEWSLMQKFKSSESNCLGIPVKNKFYRRPLMCLSKKQIENFCRLFKLNYCFDSSNANFKYERNFLRNIIIPLIAHQYPQYLKHYVENSNREAYSKNVHCLNKITIDEYFEMRPTKNVIVLFHHKYKSQFYSAKNKILNYIYELSDTQRGSLQSQLNKMITGLSIGKKGPFSFSGGVFAIGIPGAIVFYNQYSSQKLLQWDGKLMTKLQSKNGKLSQLRKNSFFQPKSLDQLIVLDNDFRHWPKNKQFKPLRGVHPLLPQTSNYLRENNIPWQWATKYFALGLD